MVSWKSQQDFVHKRDGFLGGLNRQCARKPSDLAIMKLPAWEGPSTRGPRKINDLPVNDALDPSPERAITTVQIPLDLVHGRRQNILRNVPAVLGR
jgi:hypothetical protein